jgi:hypothetical protein
MPRDFDISPYFEVVKPTIIHGFDYTALHWADKQKPLQEVAGQFGVFPETVSPPLVPEEIDEEAPLPAAEVTPAPAAQLIERVIGALPGGGICVGAFAGSLQPPAREEPGAGSIGIPRIHAAFAAAPHGNPARANPP